MEYIDQHTFSHLAERSIGTGIITDVINVDFKSLSKNEKMTLFENIPEILCKYMDNNPFIDKQYGNAPLREYVNLVVDQIYNDSCHYYNIIAQIFNRFDKDTAELAVVFSELAILEYKIKALQIRLLRQITTVDILDSEIKCLEFKIKKITSRIQL